MHPLKFVLILAMSGDLPALAAAGQLPPMDVKTVLSGRNKD
jgi:hypothetical protein